jgi:hypothetical protein
MKYVTITLILIVSIAGAETIRDGIHNNNDPSGGAAGGDVLITWDGATSTVYVVSLDGTYRNKVGDFYGM